MFPTAHDHSVSHDPADHQVHEWLILLDREVEGVWRSKWGINKILFIITRYGPFLDMPITIVSESGLYPYVSSRWRER